MSNGGLRSCETCKFYAAMPQDLTVGQCRIKSPMTFCVIGPRGPEVLGGWPTVRREHWCGEHQFNIVKAPN